MTWALTIALFGILGMIAWEDFKSREIHWYWFAGLAVVLLLNLWQPFLIELSWKDAGINLLLVGVQLAFLFFYSKLRFGRDTRFLDNLFGLGDVLILLLFALALPSKLLILFIICGTAVSAIIGFYYKKRHKLIPLAGVLSCTFMAFWLWEMGKSNF